MTVTRLRAALAGAAVVAAGLGTTTGAGTAAADPATEFPAAGCSTFADPKDDAKLNNVAQGPNDPDLDIEALTLRTTATSLLAYIKVADLAKGPMTTDGHRYSLNFTFNGHVFSASGSSFKNGTGAIRDGLAQTGQAGKTVQLGVDVPSLTAVPPKTEKGFKDSGLKVTFDQTANYVVIDLPIADITKYGGAPFGGTITAVDARATIDNYAVSTSVDTTNPANSGTAPATAKWLVGDNKCFSVPTRLALSVTKFAASRNVTAKLTTAAGQALGGKSVVFYLNGKKASTLKTAADGTAVLKNVKPGMTVKAEFLAVPGYAGTSAQRKV
jgi:hypothetical protein